MGRFSEMIQNQKEIRKTEDSTTIQVVVAGGFCTGKSSFINTISGENNLLPTGIIHGSMISTYTYFSKNVRVLRVSGITKTQCVPLDKVDLQSIQGKHGDTHLGYDKLKVELPAKNEDLDGFCFIDTPGYNNCSVGQDVDMDSFPFKEGNILFWIVDAEAGTVNKKDEEMIQKFYDEHVKDGGSAKIVIVFNKADKKRMEIASAVNYTNSMMSRKSFAKDIVDIIGFSCVDKEILYSLSGYATMEQILAKIKAFGYSSLRISGMHKY